jgi:hypothetical protein
VWAVRNPVEIATGAAKVVSSSATGLVLNASQPGISLVRVRWNPYWEITSGDGCVSSAADGWTTLIDFSPGPIDLTTQVSLDPADDCTIAQLAGYPAQ